MAYSEQNHKIFMLVDANNFYASCEREFQPALDYRPIVVLSNNDGNVISRCQLAKKLGIKMAVPYYQIERLIQQHNIAVFSSNYPLYSEMSSRFMNILGRFVDPTEQEVYSIDECFLDVTAYETLYDLNERAKEIKNTIRQWIGLPCCVGIGSSKTQAKLANHIAKIYPSFNGICNLLDIDLCALEALYGQTDVSEVWGVGRQNTQRLNTLGIYSVLDLHLSNSKMIRKHFSVVMERTVLELQGTSCIDIQDKQEPNKQIISSRSFATPLTELNPLKEAVTLFTLKAADKLRKQGSLCGGVTVYMRTNRFNQQEQYISQYINLGLDEPTDDRLQLLKTAMTALEKIFVPGKRYKKAGIVLTSLSPKTGHIYDLLIDHSKLNTREQLMQSYEQVNRKYGEHTLTVGIAKLVSKQQFKSPNIFRLDQLVTTT